jgi:CBS-domain-containing membrane protein
MNLTGTLHPPGGALAVIYVVVPGVQVLGYLYIITSLFGAVVMFFVALLMNNVMQYNKPYPKYYV